MTKQIVTISMLAMMCVVACHRTTTKDSKTIQKESSRTSVGTTITKSLKDIKGNTLQLIFDNTNNVVTIKFKGENAVLFNKKPASGIWYANKHYELRGKGDNIQLKKNGNLIFEPKN